MENTGQTASSDTPADTFYPFLPWKVGSFDHFSENFALTKQKLRTEQKAYQKKLCIVRITQGVAIIFLDNLCTALMALQTMFRSDAETVLLNSRHQMGSINRSRR